MSVVSKFMHAPSEDHMDAMIRILRYLKGASGRGIRFLKNGHPEIEGFTDTDLARSVSDRRSTSGYFIFFWRKLSYLEEQEAKCCGIIKCGSKIQGDAQRSLRTSMA